MWLRECSVYAPDHALRENKRPCVRAHAFHRHTSRQIVRDRLDCATACSCAIPSALGVRLRMHPPSLSHVLRGRC